MLCAKNTFFYILKKHIVFRESSVFFDYSFKSCCNVNVENHNAVMFKYYIKYIFNIKIKIIQSLMHSSSLYSELKIKAFNWYYFKSSFLQDKTISVLFMCFIDEFNLYYNIY